MKIKENRGITLVSLIITIIILLILAGIAFNTIFSTGSIVSKTKEARTSTVEAKA